ncbi:sensor histidine kinase [Streptacidiphilus jiangxiensis]|uniref:histidine kinase n=1 Tax=Streptacidiphilus jiangxiensis TaxID=235985 RepID=A0A1H7U5A5_STRJI|nr:histidine kinase [Streptacidiphilus jiangxiensis]SEL91437.1 Signal transduction histidine kinase [Streptacidiphilus jiangxiensis]
MTPGPGSERGRATTVPPLELELAQDGTFAARLARTLLAPFRVAYLLALTGCGLVALAGGPVLVVVHLLNAAQSSPSDHLHIYFGLLLTLGPCLVWGAAWASGGGGRAAGAVLTLPGVLSVAAAFFYPGNTPGGSHGVVLLTPFLLIVGVLAARWVASEQRRLVGSWFGRPIPNPYRPLPDAEQGRWWVRPRAATVGWLADPALGRDVAWVLLSGAVAVGGLVLLVLSPWLFDQLGPNGRFAQPAVLYGMALTMSPALVLWGAPVVLDLHARAARLVIGPSQRHELTARVQHLAETRAETIDHNAAELRRIERDLHDGAQARLVALGMALNAAEQLFDTDPAAARALVTEAKSASAKALVELRDLVRGIHPPVLADRGLVDAVQALVLDLPLSVQVSGALATRPPAAVESAAYFAVSELLANTVKHAEARRGWIEIGHTDGMLRIVVTDDGRGEADPGRGSGLRGIERRLASFDGVLAVSSPVGGPTIASLEIPCASPSPKTSSSSGTG